MTERVFNFSAGPATLPLPVLEQIQDEFLDFQGLGASIIEISHRSREFDQVIDQTDALIRELTGLPRQYRMLYVAGGARMQFSAVPMNFAMRLPERKAAYFETGLFSRYAQEEAQRYCQVTVCASGERSGFSEIPSFDSATLDQRHSYAHITSNNTLFGTRWHEFPDTGSVPLIVDATSDIFSRVIDYSQIGGIYAGLQKNLGPAGLALVIIREDLLGHALPETPTQLNYLVHAQTHSMANTINTFAVYTMKLVLEWMKEQGGIAALEKVNEEKATKLYAALDASDFYLGVAHPNSRSAMNVCFHLAKPELLPTFIEEARQQGLYGLRGHGFVGGARASIYNAMPLEGVMALIAFMREFERRYG